MKKGLRYLLVMLLITAMSINLCGCFLLEDDDYYDDYYDYYDYISNEFSDIDAYYVGLIDDYSVVREYGFDRSQH